MTRMNPQRLVRILTITLSGLLAAVLAAATVAPALGQAAGAWTPTASMGGIKEHRLYTATLLQNGQVLVAGGINLALGIVYANAFLYNPSTGEWTETGSMTTTRYDHTATLLPNGQVLVTGGFKNDNSGKLDSAELYNPSTGQWSTTGSMTVARYNHGAVLLQNGQVLIAGGQTSPVEPIGGTFQFTSGSPTNAAEIYDPSTGAFTATGSMNYARDQAQLTQLQNGDVLIAGGGTGDAGCTAELFSEGQWSLTSELAECGVTQDAAALLFNGDVLIEAGSLPTTSAPAYSLSEVYDPSTNVWQATLAPPNVLGPLALLTNGQVLDLGVVPVTGDPAAALYNPSTNEWTPTASPPAPFSGGLPGTLTRLLNGQVLATANNYAVLFTP
jgi:hypothetical protein